MWHGRNAPPTAEQRMEPTRLVLSHSPRRAAKRADPAPRLPLQTLWSHLPTPAACADGPARGVDRMAKESPGPERVAALTPSALL